MWTASLLLICSIAAWCHGETHMTSPKCDPVADGWDYLQLGRGDADPVQFETAIIDRSFNPAAFADYPIPFALQNAVIATSKNVIAYIDERNLSHGVKGPETVVKVTLLDDTSVLFAGREKYAEATIPAPADSFFSWTVANEWEVYKTHGLDSSTILISQEGCFPRHVVTDGNTVAWVDVFPGTCHNPEVWDVHVFTRLGTEGTGAVWRRVVLPHQEELLQEGVHRLSPTICGGRLLYVEYSEDLKASRLFAYDLHTGGTDSWASSSSFNVLSPRSWRVSHHTEGNDDCLFAWVELQESVTMLESLDEASPLTHPILGETSFKPPSQPYSMFPTLVASNYSALKIESGGFVVVIEAFPEHSVKRISPDFWGAPPLERRSFLEGLSGGGTQVFLLFRSADFSTITIDALHFDSYDPEASSSDPYSFLQPDLWTASGPSQLNSVVPYPMATLQGGALQTLLFTYNDSMRLHRLDSEEAARAEVPETIRRYTCDLFAPAMTYPGFQQKADYLGLFGDIIVARTRTSPDDQPRFLQRIDLDKDNDGLHDKQDRFPTLTMSQWDSDNDGVSDYDDIVLVKGKCTRQILSDPGSCTGDTFIMWIVWAVFTTVMFGIVMGLGKMRHTVIKKGQRIEFTEELELLLDEEGVQPDQSKRKSKDLSALIALNDQLENYRDLENIAQLFLLILTIFSVILVVVPLWSRRPMRTSTLTVFTWIDVFTASIFAVDLIFRWVYREDRSQTCWSFFKENWFDFPSLACDLPGLTTAGNLDVLVVARLLRVIRILKIFRVMRLYRKVTNQSAYLSLVLNHSNWLLPIIAVLLLLTVAVVIKIVEQGGQDEFASYWNCLWFCFVTATTVGYGDMTPTHWFGRLLACVLMVCGIGMIGNITARVSEVISETGYQRAQEKEKQERHEDHPAVRVALLELSVAFNPLVALKDTRKDYVDVLSKHFMTPRYMEAAIHRRNPELPTPSARQTKQQPQLPTLVINDGNLLGSPAPAQDQGSRDEKDPSPFLGVPPKTRKESVSTGNSHGTVAPPPASVAMSAIPNEVGKEISDTWSGTGIKGGVIKAAFLRICHTIDNTASVGASDLSKELKKDHECRRLRRSISPTEQAALDDVIHELQQLGQEVISWQLLQEELISTQEHFFTVAEDAHNKNQRFEWDWCKWNDYEVVQKLRALRKRRGSSIPKCMDKLYLLLLRYKLDESYKGVEDWEKMFHRLKGLIFKKPKKNGLAIEKLFAIGCFEQGGGQEEDNPLEVEKMYDWQDPIDDIFSEAEKILRQHNVHLVDGFQEIMLAVESIIMQFDRVESTRWALHHLRWGKPGKVTLIPRPPLLEERGRTNILNPLLHIPKVFKCTFLDPTTPEMCGKLMVHMQGPPDGKEGPVFCSGDGCLAKQRLEQQFTELKLTAPLQAHTKGYLACPLGHYYLCNACVTAQQEDVNLPFARSANSVGSRSSAGSLTVKTRKNRPFARLQTPRGCDPQLGRTEPILPQQTAPKTPSIPSSEEEIIIQVDDTEPSS